MTEELIPRELQNNPEALGASMVAMEVEEGAQMLVVDTQAMYELAGDELREIVTKRKHIEEIRLGITRPMDQAKANVMAFFTPVIERFTRAEAMIKRNMLTYYDTEQARIRKEQDAARVVREKAELEQRQKADEAERAAMQATNSEDALRLAQEADDARAQADALEHAAPIAEAAPAAAGVGRRAKWKAEVTDIGMLILAASTDPSLRYLIKVDDVALGALARSSKGQTKIPGVRFYDEGTMSARRNKEG